MSPTDAKRGAKRRKNKRGGGSGCGAVCTSGGKAGATLAASTPSVVNFLAPGSPGNGTLGSMSCVNGEANSVTPQFTEGPVNADFSGVLQTPFTFGLNQRAPYTAGDRCLLCRCERKDGALPPEDSVLGQNSMAQPSKTPSSIQLPLWVCTDCRRTVEKEDRNTALEQSLGNQDFFLHMPMSNGNQGEDTAAGDRFTTAAPTLPIPPAPELATSLPTDTVCTCDACNERRELTAETERESQQLQYHWSEVRYLVRCIYRQSGTSLADIHDQPQELDKDGVKELVDRLCEKDPYQLYQRLEQQAREYVLEMKVRLLRHLSTGPKTTGLAGTVAAAHGPPQAHQFISLLLEEYNALCQAARTISSFLITLEKEHLQKFQVTWELHNKHLFENLVFSEPILHSSLPALVAQLKHGTSSLDSCSEDLYRTLLDTFQQLQQEMHSVATQWQECEKRIDDYVDEQLLFKVDSQGVSNQRIEPHTSLISKTTLKSKQRMLKEDWEFFKQRRYIEEQVQPHAKKMPCGDGNFSDTMRMLSSRLNIPDCPNCNYRRRCTCDDCSLSHILTCGIMDSHITEELHIKLPLPEEPSQEYLSQVHPPSLSSGSSASGSNSSSPITIQQNPRLILPEGDTNTFISDDDEVPPLSNKFGDMYPVTPGYEDNNLVNGLHSDMNGKSDKAALKSGSSHMSSSSSSAGDEDETEVAGNHQGQREEPSSKKSNTPPPSYNHHQQVEQLQHACECHVCSQETCTPSLGSNTCLLPNHLHAGSSPPLGHQFFTDSKTPTTPPAHHLYPHIHGHLPLQNFSRPLLHPTLYPPSPPLKHKPLPRNSTSNHSVAKQPAFSPSLPDHYQNCFGNTGAAGDWNSSLQCFSLKFENLCDTAAMKPWNPSVLLPESLPGNMLGPSLADVPLAPTSMNPLGEHPSLPTPVPPSCTSSSLSSSSSSSSCCSSEAKEQKKSGAKKKCLYNFQDAFMEPNQALMATSAPMSSSCGAATVQSSDVFHNLSKEDHRHISPDTSRSGSTVLAGLSPFSVPTAPSPHLSTMGSKPFPKMAAPAPEFADAHQGLCLTPADPQVPSADVPISAPPSVCSDPDCEGHRCEGSGVYDHQPYDGEESPDDDSCSEHSSSTSTSTNQKEGKYCDCCYCEFFGHGGPPAAPTSRNYAEMREKLRLRLTKRKEEQPKREEQQPVVERDGGGVEDHRRVEDLLQFINSADSKPAQSSKAAKRARHKQKKMEERARLEAEARLREEQQLLEEQQRRLRHEEEEAALQKELLRLQELQQHRAAKKKKREKAKENTAPPQNNPQPLKQTAQNVLDNLHNGKSQLLQNLICPPEQRAAKFETIARPITRNTPKCTVEKTLSTEDHVPGSSPQLEVGSKTKAKHSAKTCEAAVRKEQESLKAPEIPTKLPNGVSGASMDSKTSRSRPTEALAPLPEPRREDRNNNRSASGKRQQQPLTQIKEDRRSPPVSNPSPSPPPMSDQPEQNGKPPSAESPQPKGKNKKNKKKKGDKLNNSIDDVFLPKDIDLDSTEMDETEREVEYFKRFCQDSARQTRQRLTINWSNFSLKKATFAAH